MNKLISAVFAVCMFAVMASASVTNDVSGAGTGTFPAGSKTPLVVTGIADFSKTTGGVLDYYKVITLPSNVIVTAVWYDIMTTNTAALTLNIGDNNGTGTFTTAVNMQTAGSGALIYSNATMSYMTGGSINVNVASGAASTGKVRVRALVVPFN